MANKVIRFQHTKSGELVSALICLGITYLFFNLSISQGNLLYYFITFIFLVYFLKFSFRLIGDVIHAFVKG